MSPREKERIGTRMKTLLIPGKKIEYPFTIPSGIITSLPPVIWRLAIEIEHLGFITTKSISLHPRKGYMEPVIYQYLPATFMNAVGLPSPGAEEFRNEIERYLPLPNGKPLVISIMGGSVKEFLEVGRVLAPVADAFELNFSCPHVEGVGQMVGSDPSLVSQVIEGLKREVRKPLIPKLSPNIPDLPAMAKTCEQAGADAISMINTVGPGLLLDNHGLPLLSNGEGSISGRAILPFGIRLVEQVSRVVNIPIIASGGITNPDDVKAYQRAGASYFAVGSALAGMTITELKSFFKGLWEGSKYSLPSMHRNLTAYRKFQVAKNLPLGNDLFFLEFSESLTDLKPGQFVFLKIPERGEKPFSPLHNKPLSIIYRVVGRFTSHLSGVSRGEGIEIRGPYGRSFPDPETSPLYLIGGGSGVGPVLFSAAKWKAVKLWVGLSASPSQDLKKILSRPGVPLHIVVDPPGKRGTVIHQVRSFLDESPSMEERGIYHICGPGSLVVSLLRVLEKKVPSECIFYSREDYMKCGIGLCGSCCTESGLRSCTDGPVFSLQETCDILEHGIVKRGVDGRVETCFKLLEEIHKPCKQLGG